MPHIAHQTGNDEARPSSHPTLRLGVRPGRGERGIARNIGTVSSYAAAWALEQAVHEGHAAVPDKLESFRSAVRAALEMPLDYLDEIQDDLAGRLPEGARVELERKVEPFDLEQGLAVLRPIARDLPVPHW